ncbi:MAG: hypothetical protein IPP83_11380 [Flavobacteriales bacterium]|nr:hypothetical protein [Flavobacteriales bacterium]
MRSPVTAEPLAKEAPAPSTGLSEEEKGPAFEEWVADRFPKVSFERKHWRSDKITAAGRYAESNKDPDMEVDLVLGRTHYPFAVECKWRARMPDGEVQFAEPYQIENYRAYMQRTKRPVFIVLGVGGSPSAPSFLYCIPVQNAGNGTKSSMELLTHYRQSMSRKAGFYFDVMHGTLKY